MDQIGLNRINILSITSDYNFILHVAASLTIMKCTERRNLAHDTVEGKREGGKTDHEYLKL